MARAGAVWVDVLPNMATFASSVREGARINLSSFGASSGREFSQAMTSSARSGMAGFGAEVRGSADRAAAAVTVASAKVASARDREAKAAGTVRVAELRLNELRATGRASAASMAAAEERLATAVRGSATSTTGAVTAARQLEVAQARAGRAAAGAAVETQTGMARMGGVAQTGLGKVSSGIGGVGKQVLGLGGLFAGFAAVDFLSHSIKEAGDFQKQMMLLVTAGGEAQGNLGLVSNGIKTLAVSTGTSTTDLAEGMYVMEKAGHRGADGLMVLKAAAQGAKDENASLSVVTNGLTSVMASYNIPASQANSVMNQMVVAAGASKTTMENFSQSLSTVLPVASKAGLSFAQVGAAIATLTSHGTSADEATQHLAFAIRSLQAPNNVATQMMSRFGINAQDVSTHLGKRGLSGTIDMLSQAIYAKMGPAGVALQATFNGSKTAAADAAKMFDNLPPAAQKIASAYESGKLSLKNYRSEVKLLPAPTASLLGQWASAENRSKGFNAQLLHGQQTSPTYVSAMQKMMGGAAGLQVALQLTGGSAGYLARTTADVGRAARHNGKDIDAWKAAQQTFNVQLDRFKESIKVTAITVGTVLLPPLTRLATWLADTVPKVTAFAQANMAWLKPVAIGVVAVAAAFGVLSVAVAAAEVVSGAKTWMLIAAGIIALGVALVYAYKHSQTFHNIVQAAFQAVRAAAVELGNGVLWLWENAIHPALTAAGKLAVWLWDNAIHPAFDGIRAAMSEAGKLAVWLWQNAILPAFGGIEVAISAVATAAKWLWTNAISPYFNSVGALATWMGNTIQAVALLIHDVLTQVVFPAIKALYDTYVSPVFNAVATIAKWLWSNVLSPVFGYIGGRFLELGTGLKGVWDKWIHPMLTMFGSAFKVELVGAVQGAVKLIGLAWDGLQALVKAPIKFVVNTVLNDGLIKAFNWISGKVGSSAHIDPIPLPKGFSRGGLVDGPGTDTSDSIPARLSRREFVVNARATRRHLPELVAMNGGIGNGGDRFAGGGLVGGIESVWGSVKHAGEDVMSALTDPGAMLGRLVAKVMGSSLGGASGQMAELVKSVPKYAISEVLDSLKGALSSLTGGGGGIADGPAIVAAARKFIGVPYLWGGTEPGGFDCSGLVEYVLGKFNIHAPRTAAQQEAWTSPAPARSAGIGDLVFFDQPAGHVGIDSGGGRMIDAPHTGAFVREEGIWPGARYGRIPGMSARPGSPGGPTGPGGMPTGDAVTRWAPLVGSTLGELGLSQSGGLITRVLRQIQTESGGDPNATQGNIGDVNNASGDLARGLMQVIRTTFDAYAGPYRSAGQYDPHASIYAGVNYDSHKFGGNPNLSDLGQGHGYDLGGRMKHGDFGVNLSGHPEQVLNPVQERAFTAAMARVGSPSPVATADRPATPVLNARIFIGDVELKDIVRVEIDADHEAHATLLGYGTG